MFWKSGFGTLPKQASFVSFSKLEKNSVLQGLTVKWPKYAPLRKEGFFVTKEGLSGN